LTSLASNQNSWADLGEIWGVSDGKRRTLDPGDGIPMEDTSGLGHSSHVKGGKDLISAIVSLE